MNDSLSNILKDNVALVGQSPENPNNWVILDVQKSDAGTFRVFEQRPTSNTLVSSESGEFAVAKWGDFASGEEALKGLSGYLDTHPIYSEYKFNLGEIGGEDEYITDGGETTVRARRGGVENDAEVKNSSRANTDSPDNSRVENFQGQPTKPSPESPPQISAYRPDPNAVLVDPWQEDIEEDDWRKQIGRATSGYGSEEDKAAFLDFISIAPGLGDIIDIGRIPGEIIKDPTNVSIAGIILAALPVTRGQVKLAGMMIEPLLRKGKKGSKGKKKGTDALRRRKADRDALMAKSRQELRKKLGPPENYSYGKGSFATYEASKVSGMESHHMIPVALFARGPASLMGLADYVPAMLVVMLEHRGVGGQGSANLTESLNTILKDKYYGKILTKADLSRAIDEVRAYYGNLGLKEYAAAVAEFKNRIFDKL
jgi:hypothetical protein